MLAVNEIPGDNLLTIQEVQHLPRYHGDSKEANNRSSTHKHPSPNLRHTRRRHLVVRKLYNRVKGYWATRLPVESLGAEGAGLGWDLNEPQIFTVRQIQALPKGRVSGSMPWEGPDWRAWAVPGSAMVRALKTLAHCKPFLG